MSAASPKNINLQELNRLIAMSKRRPTGEAMIAWSSVWGLLVMGYALLFPGSFFNGEMILLERIAVVLILAGVFAAMLCVWHVRRLTPQVEAAKVTLKTMANAIAIGR